MPPLALGGTLIQIPSGFNANGFAGCYWWHDLSDVSKVAVSGSNVTSVTDKGPNGVTLTPGTAKPTVVSAAFNGYQAVSFSAGTALLGGTSPSTSTSYLHLFYVASVPASGAGVYQEFFNAGGGATIQLYVSPSGTTLGGFYSPNETDSMLSGMVANTLCLVDYAIDTVGHTITVNLHQGATSTSSGAIAFAAATSIPTGMTIDMPNSPWAGTMCEMVAWNVIKTGTEYSTIVSQLKTKWGF